MALRKRSQIWWIDFTAPNGQRIRRSTGTTNQQQAQELHDQLKAEFWRVHKLGEKPQRLWQEAALCWVKEKQGKKDITKDIAKLKWFDAFLRDVPLDAINKDLINHIADAKESEPNITSGGTVNRYLALLRAILRRAWLEWEWVDKVPVMPMRDEGKPRVRWLTEAEVKRLLQALPIYYAWPAAFSLATGPRQSNVLDLKWEQVDLTRRLVWLKADETKNGEPLGVPLNDDALHVLEQCQGQHDVYVFTQNGKRINGIDSRKWKQALMDANIEDFRWHDLRHTWASRHIQNGTTLEELQKLGGWKTYQMVLRYAHLSAGQLIGAAQNINGSASLPFEKPTPHTRPGLYVVK